MRKCEWEKGDFLHKRLGIVIEHIRKCKDYDCLGRKHMSFHTRNKAHPLGSINVRARKYRVWRENEKIIGENLEFLDTDGLEVISI